MRSGTLNVPGIVGLGAACALCRTKMTDEGARLGQLRDRLLMGLTAELGRHRERVAGTPAAAQPAREFRGRRRRIPADWHQRHRCVVRIGVQLRVRHRVACASRDHGRAPCLPRRFVSVSAAARPRTTSTTRSASSFPSSGTYDRPRRCADGSGGIVMADFDEPVSGAIAACWRWSFGAVVVLVVLARSGFPD